MILILSPYLYSVFYIGSKGPSKRLQHLLQHPFDFVEWQCWKLLPPPFRHVETCWNVLKRSWMLKEFKAFKLCFNIRSTFLLVSGMFGMLKRSWSRLPCSFNIVEQVHAQLRRRNHGHHGCKDGSNAKQFCAWLWYFWAMVSFDQLILQWRTMIRQTILQKRSTLP